MISRVAYGAYGAAFTDDAWWTTSGMSAARIAKSIVLTGLARAKATALASGDAGYAAVKDSQAANVQAGSFDDSYDKHPVATVQSQAAWVRKWGFYGWQMNQAALLQAWIDGERPGATTVASQAGGQLTDYTAPTQPLTPQQKAAKDAAKNASDRLGLNTNLSKQEQRAVWIGSAVGGVALLTALFLLVRR
tara:strand:+ start:281 stop:853 length:573 start_codon:yes stop_codon:yes gene_type:complete